MLSGIVPNPETDLKFFYESHAHDSTFFKQKKCDSCVFGLAWCDFVLICNSDFTEFLPRLFLFKKFAKIFNHTPTNLTKLRVQLSTNEMGPSLLFAQLTDFDDFL
jgi:hypothetical protein